VYGNATAEVTLAEVTAKNEEFAEKLAGLIGEMMKQRATNPEKSDKVGDKLQP
jgi:hypothetical protein